MSSGVCQNSYQCKNGLLCHQNQCKDVLYSFEIGHHFKDGDITDTEEVFLQKLCKYGLMDTNNTCISLSSQTQPEVNEDFVKCNISEQCVYNVYPLELTKREQRNANVDTVTMEHHIAQWIIKHIQSFGISIFNY